MEFLVEMTTRVPERTPAEAVDDIRTREAARSRELAAQGHLLRLWRPPLQPGEWRTLGLFAAADDAELEGDLASMPLRVWRTDEGTPLAVHPNDPASRTDLDGPLPVASGGGEFLTTFSLEIPAGTPEETVSAVTAGEAERTGQLAREGRLLRLWLLPARGRALGLWRAADAGELQASLASLPMDPWLEIGTTPLSAHPSDPGATGVRSPAAHP